jgi:hypothetical protein
VFRAALLSIVVSLAVGPNASLLCGTWCAAKAAAASGCHHKTLCDTLGVARDSNCDNVVGGPAATAALREDVRRGVSSQDASQAVPVTRDQFVQLTIDAAPGHEPWRAPTPDSRPLSTALRI